MGGCLLTEGKDVAKRDGAGIEEKDGGDGGEAREGGEEEKEEMEDERERGGGDDGGEDEKDGEDESERDGDGEGERGIDVGGGCDGEGDLDVEGDRESDIEGDRDVKGKPERDNLNRSLSVLVIRFGNAIVEIWIVVFVSRTRSEPRNRLKLLRSKICLSTLFGFVSPSPMRILWLYLENPLGFAVDLTLRPPSSPTLLIPSLKHGFLEISFPLQSEIPHLQIFVYPAASQPWKVPRSAPAHVFLIPHAPAASRGGKCLAPPHW